MRKHLMTGMGLVAGGVLLSAPVGASPYRDKHGNFAQLALTTPLVGAPLNGGIHFTVPYLATDADGGKTGHYQITSQTSPGRGATPDFVLNIRVTDDRTQKGAELVIRSHPTTAPLPPVLRLLDCRTLQCTEDKRIEHDVWGAFVIRSQSDIATYPIELLDAHASLQLLDSALLALLPNATAGTGNWAEIMQHHQIAMTAMAMTSMAIATTTMAMTSMAIATTTMAMTSMAIATAIRATSSWMETTRSKVETGTISYSGKAGSTSWRVDLETTPSSAWMATTRSSAAPETIGFLEEPVRMWCRGAMATIDCSGDPVTMSSMAASAPT